MQTDFKPERAAPVELAELAQRAMRATHDNVSVLSLPHPATPRLVLVTATSDCPPDPSAADDKTTRDDARDAKFAGWIAEAANGNAHAFEQFYNASIQYAYSVVRRIVGNSYCEDVLSDAYFQAWRDAKRFDVSRGAALSWLLTIARSRALDRLRAENLRHAGHVEAADEDSSAIEDESAPGPDTLLESVQSATRLHAAIAKLSANERWVLALAYFRDLTHSEICLATGLPLGTVKSLISRSQQKLRDTLSAALNTPYAAPSSPSSSSRVAVKSRDAGAGSEAQSL
jgi:RNA polymerase sigma-70 factor, ECF subfamily